MDQIIVNNINDFREVIGSIMKIVPSCKFIIDDKKCNVNITNESRTLKCFFNISSVTSKEKVEFCVGDLFKLKKVLDLISDYSDEETQVLSYTQGKLFYNRNGLKFNISTVLEDKIERWILPNLDKDIETEFGFYSNYKTIDKVNSLAAISSSEEPKVYLSCENNVITAEVDNRETSMNTSAGIPIATGENIIGNWYSSLCLDLDLFVKYSCIKSDNIKICFTKYKILKIESETDTVKMTMFSSILKG